MNPEGIEYAPPVTTETMPSSPKNKTTLKNNGKIAANESCKKGGTTSGILIRILWSAQNFSS